MMEGALYTIMQMHNCRMIIGELLATLVTVIVVLRYLYQRSIRYWTYNLDEWSSYEIERGVRCNSAVKNPGQLVEFLDHKMFSSRKVKTIYECFMHGYVASNDGPCLGRLVDNKTRYEYLKFSQVHQQADHIGKLLKNRGIRRQQCVGLYASNAPEWLITELACAFQSLITVPLYDTLGLESIRHTINETEMAVMISDSEDKMKRILAEIKQFPALKMFVLLHDNVKEATFGDSCKAEGVDFLTWSKALKIGNQHPEILHDLPKPDDIFLIQYTSGTTGISKGVLLTHKNIVAAIAGAEKAESLIVADERKSDNTFNCNTPNDCAFLYLPLAHIYGTCSSVWFLYAFSSGDIQRLMLDAQLCKPTYIPLVPRVMNRFFTKVVEQTKSGFKGWLFWKCYEKKRALLKTGCLSRNTIYDWIVFRKLQKMWGGQIRTMSTGSAPVAKEVLEFWRVVFGVIIIEGYGQTENAAVGSWACDTEGGNVGHPTMNCMVRLLDLPELGYTNDNNPPQGEICWKGANVSQGYYKRLEQTKETYTPDGWLRTGDIGEFLPDGSLRIIDRRKNIFKLAQGEYIAPEKVEAVYAQCPLVSQVFVDGNSLQTYTIAVVVPDEAETKIWAAENRLSKATFTELCANDKLARHLLESLINLGKKNHLNSLEQIKALIVESQPFSLDNSLVTPTMKNKRNELRKFFQAKIDALYKAGPMIELTRK